MIVFSDRTVRIFVQHMYVLRFVRRLQFHNTPLDKNAAATAR